MTIRRRGGRWRAWIPRTAAVARARIALADGLARARRRWLAVASFERSRACCSTGRGPCARITKMRTPTPCCCASTPPGLPATIPRAGGRGESSRRAMPWLPATPSCAGAGRSCQAADRRPVCRPAIPGAALSPCAFCKDPARALTYFQRLADNVTRPISKSRGEYWQGRAYEAMGDTPARLCPLPPGRRLSRNLLWPARPRAHRKRAAAASDRDRSRRRSPAAKSRMIP